MSKQYYEIGQTFVDKESSRTLKCVEGGCGCCFFLDKNCDDINCILSEREDKKSVCFTDNWVCHIVVNEIIDQTELTQQLLIDNGWIQLDNDNVFELDKIRIFCVDGFACGLQTKQNDLIGDPFITVGELKAIAKALFKVELEFK